MNYAAAIIEGEGCIVIVKNTSGRYSSRVKVGMVDPEAVDFLYKKLGGSRGKYGKEFTWAVYGKNAAECLTLLLPFFKLARRINNAKACIELHKGMPSNNRSLVSFEERQRREALYQSTLRGGRSLNAN